MYLGQYYLYNFKFYSMLVLVAFCLFTCVSDKGDDSGDEVQLTMEGSWLYCFWCECDCH